MPSSQAPSGFSAKELAQFEDVDLHEDEKTYVQANDEELEEEHSDDDEYDEAREADMQGPAEYAQKLPAGMTGAQVKYQRKKKKGAKMTEKEGGKMEEGKKEEIGEKAKDDGFEKLEAEEVQKGPANVVEKGVVKLEAGSNAVQ